MSPQIWGFGVVHLPYLSYVPIQVGFEGKYN